jgi:hypothetical protein
VHANFHHLSDMDGPLLEFNQHLTALGLGWLVLIRIYSK